MNPEPAIYVAGIDGTEAATHVVDVSVGVARAMGPAELHLIHVVDLPGRDTLPGMPFASISNRLEQARSRLDEMCAHASQTFDGRVVGHLAAGEPWREIVQLATNLSADLVIVGTADHKGLKRLVLGSVAERVTRRAQCPVLVARRKDYNSRLDSQIAPPCPDCLAVQRETNREKLWCKQHETSHPHGVTHYEISEGYGAGSMFLRP